MSNWEKFKQALKKREEERYEALRKEVIKMRDNIERMLTMFFESTASKSQTNYSGLGMFQKIHKGFMKKGKIL